MIDGKPCFLIPSAAAEIEEPIDPELSRKTDEFHRETTLDSIMGRLGFNPSEHGWVPYGDAIREQAFAKGELKFTLRPRVKTGDFAMILWRSQREVKGALLSLFPGKEKEVKDNSQYGIVPISTEELRQFLSAPGVTAATSCASRLRAGARRIASRDERGLGTR